MQSQPGPLIRDGSSGIWVALSGDGSTVAVGASAEDSSATGTNGAGTDDAALTAGALYLSTRTTTGWKHHAYLKASNTDAGDEFGHVADVSADGSLLAVGADIEASAATGVAGNQADNSAGGAGAVYVFH